MPSSGIILASASPRRAWLLSFLKIPFEIVVPDISERIIDGEKAEKHVVRLAEEKASKISDALPGRIILAADTAVFLGQTAFGKPVSPVEGRSMLRRLRGRTHSVLTGYAIIDGGGGRIKGFEESLVTMKPLDIEEIEKYLATGEYRDKAGAYAVQGEGSRLIEKIEGSYTNVVGLPLPPVVEILKDLGWPPAEPRWQYLLSKSHPFEGAAL